MQEFVTWFATLPVLAGLALSVGSNPATYAATTDVLARQAPWLPRVGSMSAGLALGATALFTLFHFFNPNGFVDGAKRGIEHVALHRGVDLTAGATLVAVAIGLASWRIAQPTRPAKPSKQAPTSARLSAYFAIGLSSSVIGFATLPAMYLTSHVVSSANPHLVPRALAYAVFLAFLVGPFFVLGVLWDRFPSAAGRINALYARLLGADFRLPTAAFLALAGVALICFGLFDRHAWLQPH